MPSIPSDIKFTTFPRTKAPPDFVNHLIEIFKRHEAEISTKTLQNALNSNQVLSHLSDDLVQLGFTVELGKARSQKIKRPVFFGENGIPSLLYEIDGYHSGWNCGIEIEAGRALMGNAVYRDLVQACVMVQLEYLVLAVPNEYKFGSGRNKGVSKDYSQTKAIADALYGHSRMNVPYSLVLIGY